VKCKKMLFCVFVLACLNWFFELYYCCWGRYSYWESANYSCIRNVCRAHKSDFSSLCVDLDLIHVVNLGARSVTTDNFAHEGRVTCRHTHKAGQAVLFQYVTHFTV
jgi:hypothetical protein